MKVLMFGWEFPPHNSGGLGVACYGITKALSEQGVEVTFVLPTMIPVKPEFMRLVFPKHAKVSRVKGNVSPYLSNAEYLKLTEGNPYIADSLIEEVKRYAAEAEEIARNEEFDVIHAHDWLSVLAGLAARRVSGKPLLLHVHATEIDRTAGHPDSGIFAIEKRGFEVADHIAAVSKLTRNTLVKDYQIPEEKISVIHNGAEYTSVADPEVVDKVMELKRVGYKLVLFVGRITIMKGVDYLINAAEIVLKVNPKVKFIIMGSGDMEQQIIQMVAEKGLSDKIIFPGFLRGVEKDSLYKAADLFVMPSVSEPFGLVALEAIINGTPALISKQSGVAEVVPSALKVDFWDTAEMANKILAVLHHGSLREALIENSQQDIRQVSWEKTAAKINDIYQELTP